MRPPALPLTTLPLLLLPACTPGTFDIGDKDGDATLPDDTAPPDDTLPDDTGEDDTGADDTGADDTGTDDTGTDDTGVTDPGAAWADFEAGRPDALRALAEPILACVARDDSRAAVFDGCYDWHSAVHGHWALLALGRVLDEPDYVAAAEAQLVPEDLLLELDAIERESLGEVPYGYAWFLLLAIERSRQGETDLDPLGAAAAAALDDWLSGLGDAAVLATARADDYSNCSWAALNLWRWAEHVGDADLADRTEAFVRDALVPLDEELPLEDELSDTDNFFPASLMRAHAILTVLPADEAGDWLAGALPDDYPITPVTNIRSAHTAGLNFSRTWGFWSIYEHTGDTVWRDRLREHSTWMLERPEYWAQDYYSYAHWVPQFGVYALLATVP